MEDVEDESPDNPEESSPGKIPSKCGKFIDDDDKITTSVLKPAAVITRSGAVPMKMG